MTAFPAQIAVHAGTELAWANPEAADNTAVTGPGFGLLVSNASGSPVNVTLHIADKNKAHGRLAVTSRVVAVADGKTQAIPLPDSVYGSATTGLVTFDCSGTVASVTCACVSFGD